MIFSAVFESLFETEIDNNVRKVLAVTDSQTQNDNLVVSLHSRLLVHKHCKGYYTARSY